MSRPTARPGMQADAAQQIATDADRSTAMPKYVYDFAEGSKDMRDLLGGKGANLAEMTNLGLPVPPGFTITTEACQAYLKSGREPEGLGEEVSEHLEALEKAMGKKLGQSDDPLLVSVRSGAQVLDARNDGDRPQHRAQRPVGARAGRAGRRRAVRVRLLPPADPDVRQDRARHRRRALRGGAGAGQAGQGHHQRPRSGRRRLRAAGRDVQGGRGRARRPARSRRSRASRWTSPCARCSTRGTPTAP